MRVPYLAFPVDIGRTAEGVFPRSPGALRHIDVRIIEKGYALLLEQTFLHLGTAEDIRIADRAVFEDDAVAGIDIRIRIVAHRVAHEAGLARLADRARDGAVGHDVSARNASHDVECLVGECAHGSIIGVSGVRTSVPACSSRRSWVLGLGSWVLGLGYWVFTFRF